MLSSSLRIANAYKPLTGDVHTFENTCYSYTVKYRTRTSCCCSSAVTTAKDYVVSNICPNLTTIDVMNPHLSNLKPSHPDSGNDCY